MNLEFCKSLIRDFKPFQTMKLAWEGQRLEIRRLGTNNFDLNHKNINSLYSVDSKTVLGKLKDIRTSAVHVEIVD